MTKRWWYALALLLTLPAHAHNGDDHGAAPSGTAVGPRYFTTVAASENFELVLRYEPLRPGVPATLRLFVSDFATNVPIHGARLTLTTTEAPAVRLTATETAPGDYRLTGTFPERRAYGLAVQVVDVAANRADLLLLKPVEVGKLLPADADHDHAAAPWLTWRLTLVALGGVLLGGAIATALRRRRVISPKNSA